MEIKYKDYTINVNEDLLDYNQCWHNLPGILETRIKIQDLFHLAELMVDHQEEWCPSKILERLTELEYQLQDYWNFPQNKDFHTYQWDLPQCKCPSTDNKERAGMGSWIVSVDCPYHGGTCE